MEASEFEMGWVIDSIKKIKTTAAEDVALGEEHTTLRSLVGKFTANTPELNRYPIYCVRCEVG